jgi:peptidoglycan/LPS O-acetylase OafA/YrhL
MADPAPSRIRPPAPPGRSQRLASIDVLRGLAALGVVLFHSTDGQVFLEHTASAPWLPLLAFPLSFGFAGVYLFFVISGFCIHLRWAKRASVGERASIDFLEFWRRRLRRLYPPYLVALALFVAVLLARGLDNGVRPLPWDIGLHLLMLHNLDPETAWTISGVFWTLAVEEQLYLAYFLLLFLRTRLGWGRTLLICAAMRPLWFGLAFFLHRAWGFRLPATEAAAAHWGVWALGALTVEAHLGLATIPRLFRTASSGTLLLGVAAAVSLLGRGVVAGGPAHDVVWLLEQPLWGVGFWVLLNAAVGKEPARSMSLPGPLRRLGIFSYSLYLTHELVFNHLAEIARPYLPQGLPALYATRIFLLSPLAVLFAWIFFRVFERPFLSTPEPSSRGGALATAT